MQPSRRLGRNEQCWCGSGKKFKHCHINRAEKKPENPFETVKKLHRYNKKQVCLHPLSGPDCRSSKIVNAHTIQRATSLSRIAEDGHVLGFDADFRTLKRTEGRLDLKRIGINQASTFNGFCSFHDKNTFAPVEDEPFASTDEQCFLLGYRAMCRELYQKETVLDAADFMRGFDAGYSLPDQVLWQSTLAQSLTGYEAGYRDLKNKKAEFDAVLIAGSFGTVNWYVVEFENSPDVMASFGITVQFDFEGNQLQDLGNLKAFMESVYVSTIATAAGGAIVLSWIPSPSGASDAFVSSFARIPDADLGDAVIRLLFEHSENTFVRQSWWTSLPSSHRDALLDRATLACNRFVERKSNCLKPDGISYVNWPVSARRHHFVAVEI